MNNWSGSRIRAYRHKRSRRSSLEKKKLLRGCNIKIVKRDNEDIEASKAILDAFHKAIKNKGGKYDTN